MLVIFSATLFLLLLVQYSNATLNQDPLQHEEQLPRLFNLVSNNGTQNENVSLLGNHSLAMEHWTKRKSLKTLLINEVAKFHEVEGQDDYDDLDLTLGNEVNPQPGDGNTDKNITDKISNVLIDVVLGLGVPRMTLISDDMNGNVTKNNLLRDLQNGGLSLSHYFFNSTRDMKYLVQDVERWHNKLRKLVYVIYVRKFYMEQIILKIRQSDSMIRRQIVYIFISSEPKLSRFFQENILEAMKIIVISKSRPGVYEILYNQASSNSRGSLERVNWWSLTPIKKGLFQYPLLPPASKVYSNFHARTLFIPILHKPPWNFVYYSNDTIISIQSGRDDKLLSLLASKLNFRYNFTDPPERNQASALGLVINREADMFMGDLTLTYERNQVVEFTFFTLADSEAFLTHAPGTLNEALALLRPFHWKVWPPLILSAVVAGPVLYLIIKLQLRWRTVNVSQSNLDRLFSDCVWFILVILLKQNGKFPSYTTTGRMMALLFSLSATYVIVDYYSATLTSILAKPQKEQPIRNMEQLVDVMRSKEYQTFVEKNSASQSMLENGTGELVKDLWRLMRRQQTYLVDSNEEAMLLVRDRDDHVLLGGRETLFYDAKRFGSHYYHLGEKLNTRYSAVAVQMGCPYMENFNIILLRLFEAGIIDKITDDEYRDLVNQVQISSTSLSTASSADSAAIDNAAADVSSSTEDDNDGESVSKTSDETDEKKMKPLSMKPLQGCFYILLIGYILSTIVFLTEYLKDSPTPENDLTKVAAYYTPPPPDIYAISRQLLYNMRRHHTRRIKEPDTIPARRSLWRQFWVWRQRK
uniref:Glutamate receptor 1 n=3 Tax=Cacopsylla melanoneura TaxID=428564 RepID=A0A8D8YFP2_9HEMI